MSEWFTPLAVLCAAAFAAWRSWPAGSSRVDLRSAIEQQRPVALPDAANASVPVVAQALAVPAVEHAPLPVPERVLVPWRRARSAAAHEVRLMIRPLGLELVDVMHPQGSWFGPGRGRSIGGRAEMIGLRHGRPVRIHLEEACSAVLLAGTFGPFEVRTAGTRWDGGDDAPASVATLLDVIAPHQRWQGVEITGGASGVVLRRPATSTKSWMHDLWLAERFADAAAHPVACRRMTAA